MKISKHLYALAIAGACATSAYGQYTLTFNIQEVGTDVVVSASGAVNKANWIFSNTSGSTSRYVWADLGSARVGLNSGFSEYYRTPTLTPSPVMGPGAITSATSSSGHIIGFTAGWSTASELWVPQGYVSGNSLSGTATFAFTTLSSLGYSPTSATYTYTVGSGATQDTIIFNIGSVTPVPEASGSVAGLGLAMAGLYQLRRRKAAGRAVES